MVSYSEIFVRVGVFFNRIERDQCNVVTLNPFVDCGTGLTGRIITSSL